MNTETLLLTFVLLLFLLTSTVCQKCPPQPTTTTYIPQPVPTLAPIPSVQPIVISQPTPAWDTLPLNIEPVSTSRHCLHTHAVKPGDTQWSIAQRYAGKQDKQQWLRNMRWINHLGYDNNHLQPNQTLCVLWGTTI